jgi:hypothetical protein
VYALIKPFVSLCFFHSSPQDLPASEMLLGLTLFGYLIISALLALPVYGVAASLLQAIIEVTILVAYTRAVLQIAAHRQRYMQTLTALAGTGILFGLVAMPLVYSIYDSVSPEGGTPDAITLRIYMLVLAWLVVVYGHVFRHALSSGIFVGILVGMGYVMLTSMVINTVLPPTGLQ